MSNAEAENCFTICMESSELITWRLRHIKRAIVYTDKCMGSIFIVVGTFLRIILLI